MNPYLVALEHLSYIIECVIINCMGEAKTELDHFTDYIESNSLFLSGNLSLVAPQLRDAISLYQKGEIARGSGILSSVSRVIWKAALEIENKGDDNKMKINKSQKFIVFLAIAAIGAMFLYPPFEIPKFNINPGYSFILSPPQIDSDGNSLSFVNVELLIAQWLGILLIAGLAYWLARENK